MSDIVAELVEANQNLRWIRKILELVFEVEFDVVEQKYRPLESTAKVDET